MNVASTSDIVQRYACALTKSHDYQITVGTSLVIDSQLSDAIHCTGVGRFTPAITTAPRGEVNIFKVAIPQFGADLSDQFAGVSWFLGIGTPCSEDMEFLASCSVEPDNIGVGTLIAVSAAFQRGRGTQKCGDDGGEMELHGRYVPSRSKTGKERER